jgi:hypothetical protein
MSHPIYSPGLQPLLRRKRGMAGEALLSCGEREDREEGMR